MQDQLQQIFSYGGTEVRVISVDNDPWFVAKDVCDILEIGNSRQALARLDDDEKANVILNDGRQNRTFSAVNEPGLYTLILSSRKSEARVFKRWITHDVLPSIRKTGGYVSDDELFVNTYLAHADDQTKLLFKATLETVRKQNEKITTMTPKVEKFDSFMSAENVQSGIDVAKTLGTGVRKLYAFLRNEGVFRKNNTPYQRYVDCDYFVVVNYPVEVSGGRTFNSLTTKFTPKGVSFVHDLIQQAGGVGNL
ncbi:BRO family protein [Aneurinibacillus aneurinilyticus]|uniref:BRO family protein n=1 Tax=Aneurinibacillus aneurinilyticus TaxID=1391 RepID=UPI0023F433A1|nr:phage antirepressor KilAC domain-containing protein [Aneurinibacillus aneurinilyticus]